MKWHALRHWVQAILQLHTVSRITSVGVDGTADKILPVPPPADAWFSIIPWEDKTEGLGGKGEGEGEEMEGGYRCGTV